MSRSADIADLLSYKVRQLVAKHGHGPETAAAIQQLLQGERNLHASGLLHEAPVRLPNSVTPMAVVAGMKAV